MASRPRNPHPEISSPVTDLDLEAQIVRAEMAVIARDARIRRRTDVLVHRIRHDTLRHAGSGLLVGLGTLALTWWLNRRNPRAPAAAAPQPAAGPSEAESLLRDAGLSLAGLLPLIWPMLPRSLRRNITPGAAGTFLTFLSPLIARLFRRKPREPAH